MRQFSFIVLCRVYNITPSDPVASYFKQFEIMTDIVNSRLWCSDADNHVAAIDNQSRYWWQIESVYIRGEIAHDDMTLLSIR